MRLTYPSLLDESFLVKKPARCIHVQPEIPTSDGIIDWSNPADWETARNEGDKWVYDNLKSITRCIQLEYLSSISKAIPQSRYRGLSFHGSLGVWSAWIVSGFSSCVSRLFIETNLSFNRLILPPAIPPGYLLWITQGGSEHHRRIIYQQSISKPILMAHPWRSQGNGRRLLATITGQKSHCKRMQGDSGESILRFGPIIFVSRRMLRGRIWRISEKEGEKYTEHFISGNESIRNSSSPRVVEILDRQHRAYANVPIHCVYCAISSRNNSGAGPPTTPLYRNNIWQVSLFLQSLPSQNTPRTEVVHPASHICWALCRKIPVGTVFGEEWS